MLLPILLAAFWAPPAPTFSRDIAPILYQNCVSCHRPGAVAPFALLTYQDAAKRAKLIAAVTAKHFMPPWLPVEPRFEHERKLTAVQIATLSEWAAAGAPEGNASLAPKPPEFSEGWQLGKPDLEAAMAHAFSIPADGPDLYQCFAVPIPAPAVRYVRAVDIQPGNAKVVHHVILFEDTTGAARQRDTGSGYPCFGTPGFLPARGLGGWTPGSLPFQAPADIPETLEARATLVLQVHYHPDGKPETDQSRVALYFTSDRPKRHAMDIPLGSNLIDIPAGDSDYKVTDHFTTPVAIDVLGVNPHAHYVCKQMYAYAVLPNGTRRTLLRIADWNFDWQQQYLYPAPIPLPADSRIEMEFTYDNSSANVRNPNHPPKRVTYGPGSLDEMAGLHFAVVPVRDSDSEELGAALWGRMIRAIRGR